MEQLPRNHSLPPEDNIPNIFEQLEAYSWSEDPEFQSGLNAILGPSQSRTDLSRIEDLTLRARCFFYARKYNVPIDFDAYRSWRNRQPRSTLSSLAPTPSIRTVSSSNPSTLDSTPTKTQNNLDLPLVNEPLENLSLGSSDPTSMANGPDSPPQPGYPPSFAEIMELIKTGQPIPGIKDIPDIVLEGQGTESTQSKRQKPWEIAKDQNKNENSSLFSQQ